MFDPDHVIESGTEKWNGKSFIWSNRESIDLVKSESITQLW